MSGQTNSSELILTNIQPDEFISRVAEAVAQMLESKSINQSKTQEDRKVTVAEAMDLLSASKSTLRNWEIQEILTPVRVGRRVYYMYSDIVKAGNKIKAA